MADDAKPWWDQPWDIHVNEPTPQPAPDLEPELDLTPLLPKPRKVKKRTKAGAPVTADKQPATASPGGAQSASQAELRSGIRQAAQVVARYAPAQIGASGPVAPVQQPVKPVIQVVTAPAPTDKPVVTAVIQRETTPPPPAPAPVAPTPVVKPAPVKPVAPPPPRQTAEDKRFWAMMTDEGPGSGWVDW